MTPPKRWPARATTRLALLFTGVGIVGGLGTVGLAGCGSSRDTPNPVLRSACLAEAGHLESPMFHGDRARTGWNADESRLTPARVGSSDFGVAFRSAPFDSVTLDGRTYVGRTYATPLYLDDVVTPSGLENLIFVATSNGWIYALRAFGPRCGTNDPAPGRAPGDVVWKTRLTTPVIVPRLDGALPLGVLGTPAIDLARHRLYVVSVDEHAVHQAFALDLGSGALLPGWPLAIDDDAIAAKNSNGPAHFFGGLHESQRGALNLSADGGRLYVPFGAYYDEAPGFLVVLDTEKVALTAAFAGAPSNDPNGNAGMWGAGGATLDENGHVYVTTGNSPPEQIDSEHVWGQSLLRFDAGLALEGAYTAFNYCELEKHDVDVGGSSPMLLPELDAATTSTPHLVVFGGKQGNVYLVDRDHVPARHDRRRACSADASTDESLLPPEPQPQFGTRGPLNVFGPYSEVYGNLDFAKMRSTLAYFRDGNGRHLLFAAGSTKAAVDSPISVAPSLARLEVATAPGQPAYLRIDALETTLVFVNPGAPVVSSKGAANAIVWVLDENAPRTASLLDPTTPHPVLYAVDAATMRVLYRSTPADLEIGGKYGTPVIAHGLVFVGTDRLTAFGAPAGGS